MMPEYAEAYSRQAGFWSFFKSLTGDAKAQEVAAEASVQVAAVDTQALNTDTLVTTSSLRAARPRILSRRAARDARRAAH